MEPESSSPYSQVPAVCPYPEPTPSSFITAYTKARHLSLSSASSIQSIPTHPTSS